VTRTQARRGQAARLALACASVIPSLSLSIRASQTVPTHKVMSLTNMVGGARTGGVGAAGGSGHGSGSERAPLLRASGAAYAAWKPAMDVFLQRHGAACVHT
jgi:hypothetical protein